MQGRERDDEQDSRAEGAALPGYTRAPDGYGCVPVDDARPGTSPSPASPGAAPAPAFLGDRVLAGMVDFFGLYFLGVFLQLTGHRLLGLATVLVAIGWGLYNGYQQGATGQSAGKRMVRLRTVRRDTGQVTGGASGFGRAFLHVLDVVPCGLGFLWPLWDDRRQTFADKIMNTVVVRE